MDDQMTSGQENVQSADASARAAQQGADAAQENLNAFQKFMNSLFSGSKEKEAAAGGDALPAEDNKDAPDAGKEPEGAAFTQADIDAAVETARRKWQEEAKEAERIAKLTPEEAAAEEQQKKEARIAELEQQLLRKELREQATEALEKDGYPAALADLLDYSGREAMEQSLEKLVRIYKGSLEAGVKSRLRGKTPEGLGVAADTQNILRDQIARNIRGI